MPQTATVANQKGGVGKTTTALQHAFAQAQAGLRVLVVDGDTDVCLSKIWPGKQPVATLLDVLADPSRGLARAVSHYEGLPLRGQLDLVWGHWEVYQAREKYAEAASKPVLDFAEVPLWLVREHASQYDLVLFDMGANWDRLNEALLMACQYVIIPTTVEPMAINGLQQFVQVVERTNKLRQRLRIAGQTGLLGTVLPHVLADEQHEAQMFLAELEKAGLRPFRVGAQGYIPHDKRVQVANAQGVPLWHQAPDSPAAQAYLDLSQQIAGRIHG